MGMFTCNSYSQRKSMGMSVKQWFQANDISDKSHDFRYSALVRALGIERVRDFIPFDYSQILAALKKDLNLNSIALSDWEYVAGFDSKKGCVEFKRTYFATLLNTIGITEFSCAECVCILKQCAKDWVLKKEYQKYQLQWMIDHEISLDQLMLMVDSNYDCEGVLMAWDTFQHNIYDCFGFHGSLWASYSEWLDNDFGIEVE